MENTVTIPEKRNQVLVIYHRSDFDGIASREVCRYHLEKLNYEVVCAGWDYGDPLPNEMERVDELTKVYMVDICLDSLMDKPYTKGKLVWIDHHKSAIQKWGELGHDGLRVDGVAACRLCWQWFVGMESDERPVSDRQPYVERKLEEPMILTLLGEWDIFDLHDSDVIPLQLGMKAMGEEKAAQLLRNEFRRFNGEECPGTMWELGEAIEEGLAIQKYVNQENRKHAKNAAYDVTFEGLKFCALNTGSPGNSQMFEGGYRDDHDALLAWRWDGKQCYVSFYHRPGREDLDLSPIAVKHGGGGHRGAAGARMSMKRFVELGLAQ